MRILTLILILTPIFTWAQADSLALLTKNFKFSDGIYLSYDDFKSNAPSLSWDSTYSRLHTNPQNFVTLVDTIHLKTHNTDSLHSIWGFSLGGIPYINLKQKNEAGLKKYVGIRVRGNICYYSTEEIYEREETITAYNPLTGVPFREGEVTTQTIAQKPFMLSFETGEQLEFTSDNFVEWIKEDVQLVKTVMNLPFEDRNDKLFKCLLIYDDRNPVYVPARE